MVSGWSSDSIQADSDLVCTDAAPAFLQGLDASKDISALNVEQAAEIRGAAIPFLQMPGTSMSGVSISFTYSNVSGFSSEGAIGGNIVSLLHDSHSFSFESSGRFLQGSSAIVRQ